MARLTGGGDDCGKPNCDRGAEETYEGPNGNTVRVCGMHYYKLVTRGTSETSPLGLGYDINARDVTMSETVSNDKFDFEAELVQRDGEYSLRPESSGGTDLRGE